MNLDFYLRLLTITILIATRTYWFFMKNSDMNKQKKLSKLARLERMGIILGGGLILINLLGFTILRFENNTYQLIGFILVTFGCTIAVIARHTLANNWSESYEFQIKIKHRLIKNGIYAYVRHPIYGGLIIATTGSFIVAKTFLFIPVFIILMIMMNFFAEREENLLEAHFGKEFLLYKEKTKKFFPYVF